jgi:predicted HAD superfamily Cof-like phosphohydrolase
MNSYDDVKKFMVACEQTETGFKKQAELYFRLIREEFDELVKGYFEKDLVQIADGCADLKWVIEGLEHTLQLPQQEIWNEVARSNLAKIDQETGKVLKRNDGKVLKPEGWTPPDIKSILENNKEQTWNTWE